MTDKKTQGKSNRRRGGAFERRVVVRFVSAGVPAEKVPLSGALATHPGDVLVNGQDRAECKYLKGGQKSLRRWLEGNRFVVTGEARKEPLVTVRMTDFLQYYAAWRTLTELDGATGIDHMRAGNDNQRDDGSNGS